MISKYINMTTFNKNIFIVFLLFQSTLSLGQGFESAYDYDSEFASRVPQALQFVGPYTNINVMSPLGTMQTLTKLNGDVFIYQPFSLWTDSKKYMGVEGHFTIFTRNSETLSPSAIQLNVFPEYYSTSIGTILLDANSVDSGLIYETYDMHSGHVTGLKRHDFVFFKLYRIESLQQARPWPKLEIKIEQNPDRIITVRYLRVPLYNCHPTCGDCSEDVGHMCYYCQPSATISVAGSDKCYCQTDAPLNKLERGDFQCINASSITNCAQTTQGKLRDYCTQCVDPTYMRNQFETQANVGFFDIWSSCVCPWGMVLKTNNGVSKCVPRAEGLCSSDLEHPDLSQIKAFTNNLSTNLNLSITVKTDTVFNEKYFNVVAQISNLPAFTTAPLAFKLSINALDKEIYNSYQDGVWVFNDVTGDSVGGINLRKSDLTGNKLDCVATAFQNGEQSSWKCNIGLDVYNPCSGAVYAETKTPVTVTNGVLTQANYTINQTMANTLTLKCIVTNECFYDDRYTTSLFPCNNDQCTAQRQTQYAPGDYVYLKPTVSYQSNPGNFSIGVEYAAFIYKDQNGSEISAFDALADLQTVNNGDVFGFRIPVATKLVNSLGITTANGSLYLSFVIRINNPINLRNLEETDYSLSASASVNLRHLVDTRYSLTAANPIMIKIDPKYFDPNYIDSINSGGTEGTSDESSGLNEVSKSSEGINTTAIVLITLAIVLFITTIIVGLIILKRRKKAEKSIPSNLPRTSCNNEEKPVEIKEVNIQIEN
jgi:hypothetical protein